MANNGAGDISILLGNGDGTFQPPIFSPTGHSYVALADINGDGILHLMTTSGVFLGNGNATFKAERNFPVSGADDYALVVADFNWG